MKEALTTSIQIKRVKQNSISTPIDDDCQMMSQAENHQKEVAKIIQELKSLITILSQIPSFQSGPIRHIKTELHYREPTSKLLRSRRVYRKTTKIRLTGNWIAKTGFKCDERIRVIPMKRMLIILPESKNYNKNQ